MYVSARLRVVEMDGRPVSIADLEVLVDGCLVDACFEADTDAGYALCYERTADGRFVYDPVPRNRDHVKVVRHEGRVEIRRREM